MLRRLLFHVHRWTGLGAGIYLVAIGVTGAALVFRQDVQAAVYPQFFDVEDFRQPASALRATAGDALVVMREVEAAYPGYRLSGIDWPTYRRATFLAYVSRGDELKTVFAHPVSGRVTGELPFDAIRWLQEFHFNLLGGRTGVVINGLGAALLLLMCISGLVIAWPSIPRWTFVGARRRRAPTAWDLHGAVGVWVWAFLVMWAVTGVYFAFPQPFRRAVNAVSPLTVVRAPESVAGSLQASGDVPEPETLITRARQAVPDATLARFVFPYGERGTFLVVMARAVHGDYDTSDEVSLYFDQYSGELLLTRDSSRRSAGDRVMAWIGPAHMGSFGGMAVKFLWALIGLAVPVSFFTGGVMWWNRVSSRT